MWDWYRDFVLKKCQECGFVGRNEEGLYFKGTEVNSEMNSMPPDEQLGGLCEFVQSDFLTRTILLIIRRPLAPIIIGGGNRLEVDGDDLGDVDQTVGVCGVGGPQHFSDFFRWLCDGDPFLCKLHR